MAITVMIIMGPTFSSVLKNEFQFTKQLITKKNIKIAIVIRERLTYAVEIKCFDALMSPLSKDSTSLFLKPLPIPTSKVKIQLIVEEIVVHKPYVSAPRYRKITGVYSRLNIIAIGFRSTFRIILFFIFNLSFTFIPSIYK